MAKAKALSQTELYQVFLKLDGEIRKLIEEAESVNVRSESGERLRAQLYDKVEAKSKQMWSVYDKVTNRGLFRRWLRHKTEKMDDQYLHD